MKRLALAWAALAAACATPVAHRGPVTATAALGARSLSCSQAGVLETTTEGLRLFADPGFRPFAMAAAGDRLLVGGGQPQRTGMVTLLDGHGRALASRQLADDVVYAVAVAPDAATGVAAAADGRILLLALPQLSSPRPCWQHAGPATAVTYSPDGRWLASAGHDGKILLGAPATGAPPQALIDHTAAVTALCWSGDGRRLLSGAMDGKVRLHERGGRLLRTWVRLGGPVRAVRFTRDGIEAMLTADHDGSARRVRLPLSR